MRVLLASVTAFWLSLTAACTAQVTPDPQVLEGAFRPGYTTTVPDHEGRVGFRIVELGRLKVTSGRIVAADPFVYLDAPAFSFKVAPGDYPVRLAVADFGTDQRVALARIDFLDVKAVRWEMAVTDAQSIKDLKPGELFGYGVDTGTGSFADAEGFAALNARYGGATSEDYEALSDKWITAGEDGGKARGLPHTFLLMTDAGPRNNLALFASGWGDGFYGSWVGYAADGRVVTLITDFGVVAATKEN